VLNVVGAVSELREQLADLPFDDLPRV